MKRDPLKPNTALLLKLAAIVSYTANALADEDAGVPPRPSHYKAVRTMAGDPGVKEWLHEMDKLGLLPITRL